MTLHMLRSTVLLALVFLSAVAAKGSTIYNESVSGDLSNSGLAPTSLGALAGLNDIFGTTGRTGAVVDRDYFTFTVPTGLQLTSITVLPGTSPLGALGLSFIGIQSGPQVTVPTNATDATGLLGWSHFSAGDVGVNILPLMGTSGLGSAGFSGPLPSGTYSIWIQDFNVGTVPYGFEITTVAPEPSTWTMTLTGLALLMTKAGSRAARFRYPARSRSNLDGTH